MGYQFVGIGDIVTDAFIQLKDGVHIENEITGKELCINFGEKLEYEDVTVVPAVGNSANAVVSAHRLGLTSALVTDIGNDGFGEKKLDALQTEGVPTEYVRIHGGMQSNYHYVLRFGAERTILIKHYEYPYTIPTFSDTPEWIYFSSVGKHGVQYHHDVATYCKTHKIKLAFQPGSFQISLGVSALQDVYESTYIFFCNKEEAQHITNDTTADVALLIKKIHSFGPRVVCITDGRNGAHASDGTTIWHIPMYPDPAPPIDRTGAGDSFSSTVTSMLAIGMSLPDALMRGPINSMSVVQYIGAQKGLLSRDQIEQYLQQAPANYTLTQVA